MLRFGNRKMSGSSEELRLTGLGVDPERHVRRYSSDDVDTDDNAIDGSVEDGIKGNGCSTDRLLYQCFIL
jgi:hypothetical protein